MAAVLQFPRKIPAIRCFALKVFSSPAPSGVPLSVDTQYEHLTAFQLSWSPPQESLRNGIIQSYEVIIYDHQSGENRTFSTVASSVIISALPGYQYTCSVAAVTIATGPTKEIPHFQDEQSKHSIIMACVHGLTKCYSTCGTC